MRSVQPNVFVQVEGGALCKGQFARGAEPCQFGVKAQRRGTRGEAQNGLRFFVQELYISLRGFLDYFLLSSYYDFQCSFLLSYMIAFIL